MIEAKEIVDELRTQFDGHQNLVEVYISPDIGFSDGG